ncbi:nucleotidyltransferase family protein [Gloeocapsopsis sp. IPPAS B-1203]|uniref:nucleotidyltransferase family protein n=1 Tax=Gloeocapsopsis sp. IPPAS B-1203 TaxID=2049454 RepID=UPI000C1745F0|nr:nucleotidyltransferase family protein [Gloeocapsopsis sp. IPPAS B-1203]PIG92830.1 DNA polymerase subunit beta [Gloeocapsopsis sp. IPPAS B-1203]
MPIVNELLQEKRQEILQIAAKHGAYNVRVFGSVARGEDKADSDIDFLIDVGPHSPWFPAGLIIDLEELLGRKVDVAEPDNLQQCIREQVLQEAIPL